MPPRIGAAHVRARAERRLGHPLAGTENPKKALPGGVGWWWWSRVVVLKSNSSFVYSMTRASMRTRSELASPALGALAVGALWCAVGAV